jgi:hypothetical protein
MDKVELGGCLKSTLPLASGVVVCQIRNDG